MKQARLLAVILYCGTGCGGPEPVIDRDAVFERYDWWDSRDWSWYTANIPFIETPDPEVDEVYYYRWEVVSKHLTYGSPESGYTFTEFIDRPFWSGTYGAISCPLGHQLSEVRWLKNPRIIDDFSRYWLDTEGARPRSYSNWYGSGLWQIYETWGDQNWIVSMLPYMEKQIAGWFEEHYDPDHGLFFRTGHDDGMEVNINSRQADDDWVVDGYRPTLNSYLYGDLQAAARTASIAGEPEKAADYSQRAATLKARVLAELWDDRRKFFMHQWTRDHPPGIKAKTRTHETGPFAGSEHGRELIGYVPWQFNLPNAEHSVAWKYLMDPAYFRAPYGPTTAEQNDPLFYVSPSCCVWSGQSWPYATTQTLVAMANLLNNYQQKEITPADYFELLKTYTLTQYKGGRPYVAESANPFDGSWFGSDLPNHSEHYLHSGYVDLILSGLFGIRAASGDSLTINPLVPSDWPYFAVEGVFYHGHDLSLIWDRDGTKYGSGAGFTVLLDGKAASQAPKLGQTTISIRPVEGTLAFEREHNVAVNNGRLFPEITASYSHPSTPPFYANDGSVWYHQVPTNRWTTLDSPNKVDWLAVDFGAEQTVSQVKLYFLEDSVDVRVPASYTLELKQNGAWIPAKERGRTPADPAARRANVLSFDPSASTGVRVLFTHADNAFTGLAEMEVWTPAGTTVSSATGRPGNIALNPGHEPHPELSSSLGEYGPDLSPLTDGRFGLTTYQSNRWIARDTPNEQDWIQIDFAESLRISTVDVYLWGNTPRYLGRIDSTVSAPRSLNVQLFQNEAWAPVEFLARLPNDPQTMARNRLTFRPVETTALRLIMEHDLPAVTGLTEIQVWQ